ncbi:hypothetical protein F511_45448 [Dorcoceras hygrometricum]|uniref:Uncharacterized protein n=1 Tax=Dorcoceras hygrometricum TaxID=472368 RepID=A0A2Z6ZVV8_9LAMI|nr:hypothetical protein F511_45448 [Dorcoceras hygrometricum]
MSRRSSCAGRTNGAMVAAAHRCCIGWSGAARRGTLRCGRELVARGGRTSLLEWATLGAAWSTPVVRSLRNVACAAAAFLLVAAAGRPALWRVSGDVVTAGLNSSRFWFGPVPGSP